ncbi:hypothetical protein MRY82_01255 [bacterium]|nr:hypothetical protein [bacterium]
MKKAYSKWMCPCLFLALGMLSTSLYAKSYCIAHRGFHSEDVPENSLSAIDQVIRETMDGLEIDIRFTKDKMPIIFHDSRLGQTIAQTCAVEADTKIAEQNWKDGMNLCQLANGEYIPTLPQVVDLLIEGTYSGKIFLEFKDLPANITHDLEKLKALIQRMPTDQVVISSFDEKILEQFRGLGVALHHLAVQNMQKKTLVPFGYKNDFDGIDFFFPDPNIENSRQQVTDFYQSVGHVTDDIAKFGDEQLADAPKIFKDVWNFGKDVVEQGGNIVEDNLLEAAISIDNVKKRLANGEQVGVWTINDVQQLQSFQSIAQDYPQGDLYLITDIPGQCE